MLDELKRDGRGGSTVNILTYGMGCHQQRYSPLEQIRPATIPRPVPVWSLSLDKNGGEQARPIVHDGIICVTNARAIPATDVATGKLRWTAFLKSRFSSHLDYGGFLSVGTVVAQIRWLKYTPPSDRLHN